MITAGTRHVTVEVLERAKAKLQAGWVGRWPDGAAGEVCLVTSVDSSDEYAYSCLDAAVQMLFPDRYETGNLGSGFNDRAGTAKEDVLAVIDKAIEFARTGPASILNTFSGL